MKKTDILIAFVLGLLVSAAAVWFAQPKWYKDLSEEIREWREPRRRPSMNRYIERDRMRREDEREQNEQRNPDSSSETNPRTTQDLPESNITFAVIDASTKSPVTSFRYRRYFKAKRPGEPVQDIPWNAVSHNEGIFQITAERTFVPTERPRDKSVTQTELWKTMIEDEMLKRRAQSDTLEISAEGYQDESLSLFELVNSKQPTLSDTKTIRLLRLDATPQDLEKEARIREILEQHEADNRYEELLRSQRKAARLVVPQNQRVTVRGTVTFNGQPPRDGVIQFANVSITNTLEVSLAPDGSYYAEALMAGTNRLTVRATQDGVEWQEHRETVTLSLGAPNEYSYDFASTGTLVGTVTGLAEGEVGGIFAIKGEYDLSKVTEDDLYDFGEICEGEARPNKEGIFTIRELEEGKYTIIAIAERHVAGEDSSFLYVTDTVEIKAGEEASIALSLN